MLVTSAFTAVVASIAPAFIAVVSIVVVIIGVPPSPVEWR